MSKLALVLACAASLSFVGCKAAQNVAPRHDYERVAALLQSEISAQLHNEALPSIEIALVDGDRVVWAKGFGYEDLARTRPASAHTVVRVGSVSKLFTDIGAMRLVAQNRLNLDVPVKRYIPDFHPINPFGGEITLRELMSHRAGLLREPPLGNYFDSSSPSLRATIESLNKTSLVYPPGTHTKYSNAGVATVGYIIQTVTRESWNKYLRQTVLAPLGMSDSSFTLRPEMVRRLAQAQMWSYDGLSFAAPGFQLGEAPAGGLYSTVLDLSKFLEALFDVDRASVALGIPPGQIRAMWEPQAGGRAFGLGFALRTMDGQQEIGHNGAIYGFSTTLAALPAQKLGVAVVTTADSANAVTNHIAQDALRLMLAERRHQPLNLPAADMPLTQAAATSIEGSYQSQSSPRQEIKLADHEGHLVLSASRGGYFPELKAATGNNPAHPAVLTVDNRVAYSPDAVRITWTGQGTSIATRGVQWKRISSPRPAAIPERWRGLIGEYGWPYDKLYVLEGYGTLRVLIEWFEFAPLRELSPDHFQMPDYGLYDHEPVTFLRNASHSVTAVRVGGVVFPLMHTNAEGQIFQIHPLKPVEELRREALAQKPPVEKGDFLHPDLVELTSLDPTIHLDIRYATTHDFLGAPLYRQAKAFLQRPAAEAVVRASHDLNRLGYGLLIHDAYRPWYVTKMFWDGTPDQDKIFVADPSQGSRHNRGCAVDLTLYDLKTGKAVPMTGGYDEMSERSYPFYPGGTALQRWDRDLLRHAMEQQGFTVYEFEWWHFDYKDWRRYPILNLTFEQLSSHAPAMNSRDVHTKQLK